MSLIYHITTENQASAAKITRTYLPVEFADDGFIHCSYQHQVEGVANRFYAGKGNLVCLKIDKSVVSSSVIDENLEGGSELFPHLYGPLPWSAVSEVLPLIPDQNGLFHFPAVSSES